MAGFLDLLTGNRSAPPTDRITPDTRRQSVDAQLELLRRNRQAQDDMRSAEAFPIGNSSAEGSSVAAILAQQDPRAALIQQISALLGFSKLSGRADQQFSPQADELRRILGSYNAQGRQAIEKGSLENAILRGQLQEQTRAANRPVQGGMGGSWNQMGRVSQDPMAQWHMQQLQQRQMASDIQQALWRNARERGQAATYDQRETNAANARAKASDLVLKMMRKVLGNI